MTFRKLVYEQPYFSATRQQADDEYYHEHFKGLGAASLPADEEQHKHNKIGKVIFKENELTTSKNIENHETQ